MIFFLYFFIYYDSSNYSAYKSIKVVHQKPIVDEGTITKKLIIYELFNILC